MMEGKKYCRSLKRLFSGIHLVDKCLLIFFAVLLLQSACSLFAGGSANPEAEHIDIIVRTSAAGIFGYFLSANFTRGTAEQKPDLLSIQSTEDINSETLEGSADAGENVQILIAAGIGLFCLILLLIYRNMDQQAVLSGSGTSAAAAQLRDFISGCVGFLIGSPTERNRKNQ